MNFIQSLKESIGGYYRNLVSSYVRRMASRLTVLEGRVSGLYAHLESRGVPMPTDEEGNPLPKDTAHLLPTLRHLDSRRIEACTDEIADGTSLVRLLCDSTSTANVNGEVIDTEKDWYLNNRTISTYFPNAEKVVIGCSSWNSPSYGTTLNSCPNLTEVHFPHLTTANLVSNYWDDRSGDGKIRACANLKAVYMPQLKELPSVNQVAIVSRCDNFEEWYAPNLKVAATFGLIYMCQNLRKVVLGTLTRDFSGGYGSYDNFQGSTSNLIHFEIGADGGNVAVSLHLNWWNPTNAIASNLSEFQSNFHEYIAKRLATFPESGSHPTLTLSQTVRDAITKESEDLIVATKHWSLAPARTQV